jgi:hypothetical protein
MKEKKYHKLLGCFLKEKIDEIFMLVVFAAITTSVLYLYNLEMEAVWYAYALCALLYIVWLNICFVKYCREEKERRALLQELVCGRDNSRLHEAVCESNDTRLQEADNSRLHEAVCGSDDSRLQETDNSRSYEAVCGSKNKLQKSVHGSENATSTLAEREYQDIIEVLRERCQELETEWQRDKQDSLDYYSTWVHQIKTPIAVMRMQLQGEDTDKNRALLSELFRIEQYVDMVLSYIRLGSTQNDFVFQEYELDKIIRQAIHKFAPQFVHNRIRLVYKTEEVMVLTDEKWLLFIIEQLLSNAIKYTQNGTVTITVSPEMVLSIEDTGIGIASEDLPRIFEKGFTGYNGRADKKATGLGLYLCKQTADKLGIRIWAKSKPGEGSVFYIDLHQKKMVVE